MPVNETHQIRPPTIVVSLFVISFPFETARGLNQSQTVLTEVSLDQVEGSSRLITVSEIFVICSLVNRWMSQFLGCGPRLPDSDRAQGDLQEIHAHEERSRPISTPPGARLRTIRPTIPVSCSRHDHYRTRALY